MSRLILAKEYVHNNADVANTFSIENGISSCRESPYSLYSLINVPLCPFFLLHLHSRCQCFGEINIDMGPPILVMIALRAF